MEALGKLETPGLTAGALGLGPDDWLPVRGEDEVAAGEDLDPVAAWLVRVEEERLGDRVLRRAGLDENIVFQKEIRGSQDVFAVVDPEGDVVEATVGARRVEHIGDVVHQRRDANPAGSFRAIIQY